jgi:hypothetical protein
MLRGLFGLRSTKQVAQSQNQSSVAAVVPDEVPPSDTTKLPQLNSLKKDNEKQNESNEKTPTESELPSVLPAIPAATSAPSTAQSRKQTGKSSNGSSKPSTSTRRTPGTSSGPDQDVFGCVQFLRGKLKEMTDLIGGPDPLRQRRAGRSGELLKLLALLVRGEDEDTEKVKRGRSLDDTSRHRPDLDADPDAACARFADPRLAALRRFPEAAAARITLGWETSAVDFMLASSVLELLRYLEGDAGGATREAAVLRGLVGTMADTLRPVASAMSAVASREPDLVWVNMKGVAERAAAAALAAGATVDPDAAQRLEAVARWLREREAEILAIMRNNVEMFSPSGESLWGRADERGRRLRVREHRRGRGRVTSRRETHIRTHRE